MAELPGAYGRGSRAAAADVRRGRRAVRPGPAGVPRGAVRRSRRAGRADAGRRAARGGVRDGQGHPPAGPARLPDHLRRARRGAGRGGPAEPGRVRGRGGAGLVRGMAATAPVRPGVRGHRLALDRSRRPLPAGLAGAAARRSSRLLGGRSRVSRGRRSVLRGNPGHLRRDRRGAAARPGHAAARRAPRRPGRDRGQRAVRGHRRPPVRLGAGLLRPRSTSSCSRRSPGTWTWPSGSGGGCTARSGGGWRCAATIRCGGAGARCCTSREGWAERRAVSGAAGPGGGIPGWTRCPWSCPAAAPWPAGSRGRRGRGAAC